MSYSDSQRRYPFPSGSNDAYRQREPLPYVDEEYVLLELCTEQASGLMVRPLQAYEGL